MGAPLYTNQWNHVHERRTNPFKGWEGGRTCCTGHLAPAALRLRLPNMHQRLYTKPPKNLHPPQLGPWQMIHPTRSKINICCTLWLTHVTVEFDYMSRITSRIATAMAATIRRTWWAWPTLLTKSIFTNNHHELLHTINVTAQKPSWDATNLAGWAKSLRS